MSQEKSIWDFNPKDPNFDARQKLRGEWFEKIQPKPHWKAPIDCWISIDDYEDCAQACIHFTGSRLKIMGRRAEGKEVHVKAKGYWLAIGS